MTVKCGDCKYFVRDGKCNWYGSAEGKRKDHPFSHAPFWVWSDCYSDREQVRANVTSGCPTFVSKVSLNQPRGLSAAETPSSVEGVTPNTSIEVSHGK